MDDAIVIDVVLARIIHRSEAIFSDSGRAENCQMYSNSTSLSLANETTNGAFSWSVSSSKSCGSSWRRSRRPLSSSSVRLLLTTTERCCCFFLPPAMPPYMVAVLERLGTVATTNEPKGQR